MVRHHVADRGKKPPTPTKAALSACVRTAPSKSTNQIAEMQNAFKICSASNLSRRPALAQQTRQLGALRMTLRSLNNLVPVVPGEQRPEEDPIQVDGRGERTLAVSSNVALSYRKPPATASAPATKYPLPPPMPLPWAWTPHRSPNS